MPEALSYARDENAGVTVITTATIGIGVGKELARPFFYGAE